MKCIICGGKTRVVQTIAYEAEGSPRVLRHRKCCSCGERLETQEQFVAKEKRSPANAKQI